MVTFTTYFLYLVSVHVEAEYIPNDHQWLMEQPRHKYSQQDDDANVDEYPFVIDTSLPSIVVYPHWTGVFNQTNTNKQANYSAFVAQINNNSKLSFEVPNINCFKLQPTSTTAKQNGCDYATNGGFFSFSDPYYLPQLISNGRPVAVDYNNIMKTTVGIDVENEVVSIGYIHINESSVYDYHNLLSGTGWLVRNGQQYVNQSMDIDVSTSFVQEKAPRTGLGIWNNGSFVILQVDGQENIAYGMDLWEFSQLFLRLGVDSAVNFDGGGSSTSVSENVVINYPTCMDNSVKCERAVTSIICTKH